MNIYTLYLIGNFSGWIVWHVKKLLPTRFEKYFPQDLQHLSLWTLSTHCAALCPCVTLMMLKLSWTVCISNVSTTGALQWWWALASIREGSFTPVRMLLMMTYINSHKDSKFEWKAKKKSYYFSWGVHLLSSIKDRNANDKQSTVAFLCTRMWWPKQLVGRDCKEEKM